MIAFIYLDLFTTVSQSQRCMWDDIDYNQHMVMMPIFFIKFTTKLIEIIFVE